MNREERRSATCSLLAHNRCAGRRTAPSLCVTVFFLSLSSSFSSLFSRRFVSFRLVFLFFFFFEFLNFVPALAVGAITFLIDRALDLS